jgi:hypothetical protein
MRFDLPALSPRPGHPRRGKDSGQSTVEGAIVLPAMTFLILTIIQLTMIQHARLMTEYAAFSAARAGIVFNGDKKAMEHAAMVALVPTFGRSDSLAEFEIASNRDVGIERTQRQPYQLPIVSIETLSPKSSDFSGISIHTNGQEIDFDDVRSASGKDAVQANILQIRLHYYYKMKIPFANQILQGIFFAQHSKMLARWDKGFDMTRPESKSLGNDVIGTARSGFKSSGGNWNNGDSKLVPDYQKIAAASEQHLYYFPLQSTYSMRMQSNFFLVNADE